MSSPWDPELLERLRDLTTRAVCTLVEIDLIGSPLGDITVRATNRGDIVLPVTGEVYENGAKCTPVIHKVQELSGGLSPAETSVRLLNRQWAVLGGLDVFGSLATFPWQGSPVRIYLWERSVSDGSKRGMRFNGTIDTYSEARDKNTEEGVVFNCTAPRQWNQPQPAKLIDLQSEPAAPDQVQNQPYPIILGDWPDFKMRTPWTTAFSNKVNQQEAGAGRGVFPLIIVDPGTGAAKVKLLAAGHKMTALVDTPNGYGVFVSAGDVLAPLPTGMSGLSDTFGASETYYEIDDDSLMAYYAVRPIDVRVGQNTATNPKRAMDPFDETSFATLAQPSNGILELQLPTGPGLGHIEAAEVFVAWRGNVGNTHKLRVYPYNPNGPHAGTAVQTAANATATTPQILTGNWDSGWWTQNWDWGGISDLTNYSNMGVIDVRLDFSGGTANTADIFWVIIRVKYRPNRDLVVPAKVLPAFTGDPQAFRDWMRRFVRYPFVLPQPVQVAPTYAVSAQFFSHGKGAPDDGMGTYTDAPNSVISNAADLMRYFLGGICGETSFELAYNPADPTVGFGSWKKARYQMGRGTPGGPKLACYIGGSQVDALDILLKMAEQSLSCVLRDTCSEKWLVHPWIAGEPVDYDLELQKDDLPDLFEADVTSDIELLQGYRVQYGLDYFKSRMEFETLVTPDASTMGQSLPTWRDQKPITIDATNDKVDYKYDTGLAAVTATLTHATYTSPHPLAADLETQVNAAIVAAGVANRKWRAWHGFNVTAATTTIAIEYIDNTSGLYTGIGVVSIDAKDYRTPDALAAAWTKALNDAQFVATIDIAGHTAILQFLVTYNFATNVFSISSNYAFRIRFTTVGGVAYQLHEGWLTMGWNAFYVASARNGSYGGPDPTNALVGAPITAPTPMYAERYKLLTYLNGRVGTANIVNAFLWGTGAHTATCPALELGWDKLDITMPGSGDMGFYGTYPRNMREATARASRARYGSKLPGSLSAEYIHDENTALLARNTGFDFTNGPRAQLKTRTHMCPDIQLMRKVGVGASCDGIRPYPKFGSDGSWQGKPMRVLELTADIDESYDVVLAMKDA